MKRARALAAAGSLCVIGGCSKYLVAYRPWHPAEVTLPRSISKVAVINRAYLPKEERKKMIDRYLGRSALIGGLTGGLSGAISAAAGAAIDVAMFDLHARTIVRNVASRLQRSGCYQATPVELEGEMKGASTGTFPEPLKPEEIQKVLTKAPDAQAIISLEMFVMEGATQSPFIFAGFRVYDASSGKVLDEHIIKEPYSPDIWNTIASRVEERYYYHICPHPAPFDQSLDFYVKGSPELVESKSYLERRNFDEAVKLWEKAAGDVDPKAVERAVYNLTQYHMASCNVDEAQKWLDKGRGYKKTTNLEREWRTKKQNECLLLLEQMSPEELKLK